jgi:hypothetical protein
VPTTPNTKTPRKPARSTAAFFGARTGSCEQLIYYVAREPGAPFERFVHAFDMRWFVVAELRHLLARAGFDITALYGDYDRSPLVDGSPEIVVCAQLA